MSGLGEVYKNQKGELFVVVDEVEKRISGVVHTKYLYSLREPFTKLMYTKTRVATMESTNPVGTPRYLELRRQRFEVWLN